MLSNEREKPSKIGNPDEDKLENPSLVVTIFSFFTSSKKNCNISTALFFAFSKSRGVTREEDGERGEGEGEGMEGEREGEGEGEGEGEREGEGEGEGEGEEPGNGKEGGRKEGSREGEGEEGSRKGEGVAFLKAKGSPSEKHKTNPKILEKLLPILSFPQQ